MAQMTSNKFGAVTRSHLVWALTRGSITHLWQQTSKWAATMTDEICRSAQRRSDPILPPPDLWHQQYRRDILRIEARRIL